MHEHEIKDRLDAMIKQMSEKGYVQPGANFSINQFSDTFTAWCDFKSSRNGTSRTKFFYGDDANDAVSKLEIHVGDLENVKSIAKKDFLESLGRVIDQGRDVGIEIEFLNPLTDAMKKLSANIIEHKEA